MAKSNVQATRRKPTDARALRLQVRGAQRPTPTFARITLGGPDLAEFGPMGDDQWFRLFLPTGGLESLRHVPDKLTTASYARYMLVPASQRPVIRNYTVRAYRAEGVDGPEIDVDFVVHGTEEAGDAGPASLWAQSCSVGDEVAIIDEGAIFNAPAASTLLLAADESALPAVAGILRDAPRDAVGTAVIEVPEDADRQVLDEPEGVEVRWVVRGAVAHPGEAALAEMSRVPVPAGEVYAWVAGESDLATGLRRHWVKQGIPKTRISFCGYWKAGDSH
ncbi:putative siderophore interacting protein [Serinicoccus hydrothermalis]|uniref:Putative siderophore interacting protein n=1 Tax=Serinicoccus hydrothermalis TaxID=1758689 RepID=A0A1B1NDY8_9MICO|nr:siderophore-interacting protein [Serinicoccus hydrothermalis]ANS79660.1 putative siderophore interacting protein [Serinicoccus hydrothermalis]